MKSFVLFLVFMVLCPALLTAGKDADLFEQAGELSYEGQLKTAKELMEGKTKESRAVSADDGWDGTSLMLSMIWGAIGTGFFIYGKKQAKAMYLICGIGLFVIPYFISSALYNVIIGTVLTILPFKVEI